MLFGIKGLLLKLDEFIFDGQCLSFLLRVVVVEAKYRLVGDTLWYSWMGRGVRRLSKGVDA